MGKLKDGELGVSYDLSFIKSTRKVEVYINLNYRSYDGNSSIDDECVMSVLKLNEDVLLDSPYSLGEMILCRVEEKILEYVKDHFKRVLSKVDTGSSVDSYSLRYVTRAKVSYDGDECIITAAGE
nr:MAG TPA: hypothetical protein [Caudoviricetes sp.]